MSLFIFAQNSFKIHNYKFKEFTKIKMKRQVSKLNKKKLNYPWLKPQESHHVITLRVKFVVHVSNLVIVTGSTSTT